MGGSRSCRLSVSIKYLNYLTFFLVCFKREITLFFFSVVHSKNIVPFFYCIFLHIFGVCFYRVLGSPADVRENSVVENLFPSEANTGGNVSDHRLRRADSPIRL